MRLFARRRAAVDILTPVYRAEAFLTETLDSILGQQFDDLRLILAVEPSDDGSAAICRDYARRDRRVDVVENKTRRGFAGNCNFLASRAKAPFAAFAPHDDVMDPAALGAMVSALEANPEAAAVAPAMTGIGPAARTPPESVAFVGDRARRCADFLLNQRGNPVYRGLFRVDQDQRKRPSFPAFPPDDFVSDLSWTFQLLQNGEIAVAPGALVAKRYYAGSTSANWLAQGGQARALRFAEAVADMLRRASTAPAAERGALYDAAIGRLAALGLNRSVRLGPDRENFHAELFPKAFWRLHERLGPGPFSTDETPTRTLARLSDPDGPLAAGIALSRAHNLLQRGKVAEAAAALDRAERFDPQISYLPTLRARLAESERRQTA